jgi:amino acid transporter/GNAT superfamily N-acetyltransferase
VLEYRSDKVFRTLAGNRLDVAAIVFIVISAAAPLIAISAFATIAFATTGEIGLPIAYLVVTVALIVFAVGFVAMSRHVTNAGALYAYVTRGFGRITGVSASFVAVLAYAVLPIALYGGIGAVLAGFLEGRFDVSIPWWLIALAAWAIVTTLGVLRVEYNSRVLAVLLIGEILVVLLFDLVFLGNPAGGTISFDALSPGELFTPGIGTLLAIAFLGFLGFESGAAYSEEARDPKRTAARATYIAIAVIGILYALSTWALTVVVGPGNIDGAAGDQASLVFTAGAEYLGTAFIDIGQVLFVTSLLAALISFHNTASRYLFALGREHVLPAKLGQTSGRTGAPYYGSLTISGVGLLGIVLFAGASLDPLADMFFILARYGMLGVLVLLAITSFSVIAYFGRNANTETAWRRTVAPAIGGVFLTGITVLVLIEYGSHLGRPPGHVLNWALPASFAVVAGVGALWGLYLRNNRPDVYRNIGLGAASVVEPLVPDPAAADQWWGTNYPGIPAMRDAGTPPQGSFPQLAMPRVDSPPSPLQAPPPPEMMPVVPAAPRLPLSQPTARDRVIEAQPAYSVEPLAHLMAAAYFTDELVQWLIPDIQEQGQVCLGFFRTVVQQALATGVVDVLGDYSGAAIWYPVGGNQPVFTPPRQSPAISQLSANLLWRLDLVHHATEQARPADAHHFLAFAAVWPGTQKRGLGAELISHRLQKLDAAGSPAYLEAPNEAAMGLYGRLGFQQQGKPITLPNGPSMYPMWRPAQKPAALGKEQQPSS